LYDKNVISTIKEYITNGGTMQKINFPTFIAGALLLAFLPAFAFADQVPPTHSCTQLHKPLKFKREAEVNAYKVQVESYRKCINDFIEEQNQAIQKHKDAANHAIEEWNFFVNVQSRL
jgi:hypothetical protein